MKDTASMKDMRKLVAQGKVLREKLAEQEYWDDVAFRLKMRREDAKADLDRTA